MRLVSDFALAIITIWQEARGEPQAGRQAVGEVVRHRMAKKNKTVAEIVLAPYQFSGYNTKDPNRVPSFLLTDDDPIVKLCAQAWLDSASSNMTEGATLYLSPSTLIELNLPYPDWAKKARRTVEIGRHEFFVEDEAVRV